jgi:RHS repeat-associated protein
VTLPDGNRIQTTYAGNVVTVTDPTGRKLRRETDGLGRLVKVTEQDSSAALTQETVYTYTLLDKLAQVNQGGQTRSYKYDALGRLLYERVPEQSAAINDGTGTMWSSKYTYTEYNKVATRTDARGVVTTYTYNTLNNLTQVSYNTAAAPGVAETPTVIFGYDTNSASPTNGMLTEVQVLGTSSYAHAYKETINYDAFSRVSSVTRWILGQTYDVRKTYTTSYEYNAASQTTRMTHPSGYSYYMNHDSKGRIQSLSPYANTPSGYVSTIGYDTAGQVTGWSLGNGAAEAFGYNQRGQLTSQTATKGAVTLMSLTYNYQAQAGQMGAATTAGNAGKLMSATGTVGGHTESASYTYDLLGRLATSSQTANGVRNDRRFAYDRWGNRTGMWDALTGGNNIQGLTLQQSAGAPTNRIQSVAAGQTTLNYTYDAAGNVTNDGRHSYQYDGESRLVKVDSGAAEYRYDHNNRRVAKIAGGAWTHYIWEGSQLIAEHDATTPYGNYGDPPYSARSSKVDYTHLGSKLVSTKTPTLMRYYHSDHLSVRLVLDSQAGVVGRQAHLPFGEDVAPAGEQAKQHFTSYQRDQEVDIDYALNRHYANSVGRFMQCDPLGPGSANLEDPQSFNRYAYTANDPINRVDPEGLSWLSSVFRFVGRVVGAVFNTVKKVVTFVWNSIIGVLRAISEIPKIIAILSNRTPCNVPAFERLSAARRSELADRGVSAEQWNNLGNNQRLGYFNIVAAIAAAGLSLFGWVVDWDTDRGIHQDRVFFIREKNVGATRLLEQVQNASNFEFDIGTWLGFAEHANYTESYRQTVFFRSLQMSFTPNGRRLDADLDMFNPNVPSGGLLLGLLLHFGVEYIPNKITGGKTNPMNVAYRNSWECE